MNQSATKELLSLGLRGYFIYPKSIEFMKEIINHGTNDNLDLILDFLQEVGYYTGSKVAYDFCKNELNILNLVINDITIQSVR